MNATRARLLALSGALLTGCGGSDSGEGTAAAIPTWGIEVVHEIGSIDDSDEALTDIGTVVIGPDGALYIAQEGDANIRVYDAEESLRGTIGRRGEGPGEIGGLQTFGIQGDSLWVLDQGNGRLTWFSLGGEFASDEPWSPAPTYDGRASINYAFPLRFRLRPDGSSLAIPGVLLILQAGETAPEVRPAIVTLGPDAEIRDTVILQSLATPDDVPGDFLNRFPTDPEYDLTAAGDGVLVVERAVSGSPEPGFFRFLRFDLAGDTAVDRRYGYEPIVPDGGLEARIFDGLSETLQRRYRDRIYVPSSYPPVTDLVMAQDGTAWLERERVADEPVEWWAIDPEDGEVLGRLTLPSGHRVAASSGQTLITTREDEFEVPYAVRWRITR